jgi:hypothetical protein
MTALIHENAVRLGEVISELKAEMPALIRGFRTRIVDGNALAATDHRLKELRKTGSAPLPGKSLVVFDYERDITVETIPCEDGHAQERSLFGKLLNLVRKGEVWIADRNFCTKKFLEGIVERGAHFIIRQHAGLRICFLSKLVPVGTCDNGKVFEQKVRIGADPKGIIGMAHRCETPTLHTKSMQKGVPCRTCVRSIPKASSTILLSRSWSEESFLAK